MVVRLLGFTSTFDRLETATDLSVWCTSKPLFLSPDQLRKTLKRPVRRDGGAMGTTGLCGVVRREGKHWERKDRA